MSVFGTYSRYYNLFYKDKDYAGESRYVQQLITKRQPGAESILDLGCGTGQHDFHFAQDGCRVTGVDRSPQMLSVAEQMIDPDLNDKVDFHVGDIRDLRLNRTFDVVVSLFHVISYQAGNDDLRAAFATAREHLSRGGLFIFDAWYGPAVLTDRPVVRVKRLEDEKIAVTRIVEPIMHPNDNLVDLHYEVMVRDKTSGKVEEIREVHRMRYLFLPEIESFLHQAGMTLVNAAEWMTDRPLGFDTWGGCFVAERRGE